MIRKEWKASVSAMTIGMLVFMNVVLLKAAYEEDGKYYGTLLISATLLAVTIWERMNRRRNA